MIQCVKLVNGEELIGEVMDTMEGTHLVLVEPMQIVLVPSQNNTFSVGLAPFLVYAKKNNFLISRQHILFDFEPSSALESEYRRIRTGIVVAQESVIKLL